MGYVSTRITGNHERVEKAGASGDLENTADSVPGLYREEMDHPGDDVKNKKIAELSVLKKRQLGEEVGTIRRLVWVGESYRDLAHVL